MLTWILSNTSAVDATHKTVTTATGSTEIANLAYGYYVVYPLGATDTSASTWNWSGLYIRSIFS